LKVAVECRGSVTQRLWQTVPRLRTCNSKGPRADECSHPYAQSHMDHMMILLLLLIMFTRFLAPRSSHFTHTTVHLFTITTLTVTVHHSVSLSLQAQNPLDFTDCLHGLCTAQYFVLVFLLSSSSSRMSYGNKNFHSFIQQILYSAHTAQKFDKLKRTFSVYE